MGVFEGEGLFPVPVRSLGTTGEHVTPLRDDDAELVYSLAMERAARNLGRQSLFELGPDGMYHTQELF